MKAFAPDPKPEEKKKKDVSNSLKTSTTGMYIWALCHLTFQFLQTLKIPLARINYTQTKARKNTEISRLEKKLSQVINRQVPNMQILLPSNFALVPLVRLTRMSSLGWAQGPMK